MKILYWHGYLLSGSGSNVVTANLARTWRRAGHEVLLLCQERRPELLDFVDAAGDFDEANAGWSAEPTGLAGQAGRCVLVRPSIGEVLPVYVYDEYEGFTAKRFVELTEAELAGYVGANVKALETAIAMHDPDAIFVNHEVMGPYIAKLATGGASPYVVMLHGSALEYVVRVDPRYLRYAEEGLGASRAVVGGSNYMIQTASSIVGGWKDRAVVVNPGCDVELFAPGPKKEVEAPVAGFVGKLITAKGPHHLLSAMGLTTTPDLSAVFVGYGGFQDGIRALTKALQRGDVAEAREIAQTADVGSLDGVLTFLEKLEASPADAQSFFRRIAEVPIEFTGRLEHGPLSENLPTWDVLVVPSVVPEAFGMVAAEAAASGVLPIVPSHSGIGEAGAAVEEALGLPGFLTFDPNSPIDGIAAAIDRVLAIPYEERRTMGRTAADLAHERWSWDHVAERLLEVAV